ncbi:USE1 [Cervus elaphus hippelaphus]|uniref:Vesicle transport protein USE1 n=1 Tax=Cervus elaphus hippelaphus TaxID=46360 RepID=A0A212D256_CEREH|nr:USE1 [Cervus elaphus hippelaphus]
MAPAEGAEYHWVGMAASRLELNLVRLLCRCEAMAAEKRDPDEWRLEKPAWPRPFRLVPATSTCCSPAFSLGLSWYLLLILGSSCFNPAPILASPLVGSDLSEQDYVGALEDMLQALKAQASKPASEVLNEYSRKVDFLKGMLQAEKLTSSSEKALANQFLAPGRVPTTARERVPATKTVHLQSRARYTSEMRSELLGTDSSEEPELDTLSHSLKMADQNLEKLKTESERLEQHTQKSVNWLLWAMLIVVCFIFISMILFIRIMPKLK